MASISRKRLSIVLVVEYRFASIPTNSQLLVVVFSKSKCVKLRCHVPIEFEYELKVVKEHADFQVFPLKGTIPALGEGNVFVRFQPSRRMTASMQLHVLHHTLQCSALYFTSSLVFIDTGKFFYIT